MKIEKIVPTACTGRQLHNRVFRSQLPKDLDYSKSEAASLVIIPDCHMRNAKPQQQQRRAQP